MNTGLCLTIVTYLKYTKNQSIKNTRKQYMAQLCSWLKIPSYNLNFNP